MRTIRTLASLMLASTIALATLVAAPTATAAQWPTHVKTITNYGPFNKGTAPYFQITIRATDGPGRSLHGRASLWVNGKAQRIRDLEPGGWRSFRIDRGDLPNGKTSRIQVRINPRGDDHRTTVVTRYVKDSPPSSRGQKILNAAKSQIGKPYRYGAAGPGAYDCSGLSRYAVLKATGRKLPHSSAAQRNAGQRVGKPQVGDIVWTPGHVSIYAGHGKVVEAAKPGTKVRQVKQWQSGAVYIRP